MMNKRQYKKLIEVAKRDDHITRTTFGLKRHLLLRMERRQKEAMLGGGIEDFINEAIEDKLRATPGVS